MSQSWHTNLPIETLSTKNARTILLLVKTEFLAVGSRLVGIFNSDHLETWLLSITPWRPLLTAYNSILGNARATWLWDYSHTHLVYFEFPQHSGVFLLLNRTLQDLGPTTMLSRSGSGNGSSFSNSNCRNMIAQIVLTCSNNMFLFRCLVWTSYTRKRLELTALLMHKCHWEPSNILCCDCIYILDNRKICTQANIQTSPFFHLQMKIYFETWGFEFSAARAFLTGIYSGQSCLWIQLLLAASFLGRHISCMKAEKM